ncbi:LacI family DNA-binding transcriptional regulator [Pseudactinotalea sp. Z1739]|uniref:LacI family DNA-binding transcriptional regulator n=1 Tax=Pseudactinotalea sp. Z1739 TaxID=3413028 RepID=UPI003C7A4C6C
MVVGIVGSVIVHRTGGRRSTTIYDVAEAAGVAPSTVSRAFSRPGRVNAETAERIRTIAAELGYRANPQARALSTTRTMMLAVVLADVTNPGFFDLVRGAGSAAREAGYTMMLAESQESPEREREILEAMAASADGIVLAGARMSDAGIRQIAKVTPIVMVNRDVTGVPSVVVDLARGAHASAEYLHRLGHTEVTYLSGPEASWPDGMRWHALREAGVQLGMRIRRSGPYRPTVAGGVRAGMSWWEASRAGSAGTAVVAYNDLLAIGFIRAVSKSGGRIPDDVSVVGFDNTSSAELITPELTTVAAPMHEVGVTAATNVIALARGATSTRSEPVVVPTRLVQRDSCAVPGR